MTAPALRLAALSDRAERDRIETFVAECGGTVFHRPAWLDAVARGCGSRALGLVAEDGGAMAGWLPLSDVRSPVFGRALVSSGFAVGGGALAADPGVAAALADEATALAARAGIGTVDLRGGTASGAFAPITGKHATFAAPLAPDRDSQLAAVPRKARAEVRKALAGPLTLSHGRDAAHRAAHFACYAESVRNLGTPVFPRALFAAMLDAFGDDALISVVRHEGRPVASVLTLFHGGAAMPYWGGGGAPARRLRAAEFLYFNLMDYARQRGCTRFDFGRSKVGSGAFAYKKNWGFLPEPLTYWLWSRPGHRARSIDPTADRVSLAVAAWKKLPLPLANRIGPWIARGLG